MKLIAHKAHDKCTIKMIPDPNLIHHSKKKAAAKMAKLVMNIVKTLGATIKPNLDNKTALKERFQ